MRTCFGSDRLQQFPNPIESDETKFEQYTLVGSRLRELGWSYLDSLFLAQA
jgi:hypothetical protein